MRVGCGDDKKKKEEERGGGGGATEEEEGHHHYHDSHQQHRTTTTTTTTRSRTAFYLLNHLSRLKRQGDALAKQKEWEGARQVWETVVRLLPEISGYSPRLFSFPRTHHHRSRGWRGEPSASPRPPPPSPAPPTPSPHDLSYVCHLNIALAQLKLKKYVEAADSASVALALDNSSVKGKYRRALALTCLVEEEDDQDVLKFRRVRRLREAMVLTVGAWSATGGGDSSLRLLYKRLCRAGGWQCWNPSVPRVGEDGGERR